MRKAYPILAVALTTTACGAGAIESSTTNTQEARQKLAEELSKISLADALAQKEHFLPLCDANGYPLVGNVNPKGGGTTAAQFCEAVYRAPPAPTPTMMPTMNPPDPKPECPTQLNEQLSSLTLDEAVQQYKTFRPLCDKDGYPLCGNLNGKVITTASQFCQALRDKNLLQ